MGKVTGVSPAVFRPDPDGISVNWLEYQATCFDDQFARMCRLFRGLRTVKPSHLVGLMQVAEIQATGTDAGRELHVEHDPIDEPPINPGHSLIKGATPDDVELLQELNLIVELREFAPLRKNP